MRATHNPVLPKLILEPTTRRTNQSYDHHPSRTAADL